MTTRRHSVHVAGIPEPQGSKDAFRNGSKIVVVESNKDLEPWRQQVVLVLRAHRNREGIETYLGPVGMRLDFVFPYLKHETHGQLVWKHTKPDIDKLERAILDAGTAAGLYKDDGQVVRVTKRKLRGPEPGCTIEWWEEP